MQQQCTHDPMIGRYSCTRKTDYSPDAADLTAKRGAIDTLHPDPSDEGKPKKGFNEPEPEPEPDPIPEDASIPAYFFFFSIHFPTRFLCRVRTPFPFTLQSPLAIYIGPGKGGGNVPQSTNLRGWKISMSHFQLILAAEPHPPPTPTAAQSCTLYSVIWACTSR